MSKIDAAIATARARTRAASPTRRRGARPSSPRRRGRSPRSRRAPRASSTSQKARVEQVRRQLAADVLEPARARKAAAESAAKGAAAQIVEQGRATASAMTQIAGTWREVGPAARNVFLMQKVADLTRIVMGTVKTLKIEKLTVLGGIGGAAGGTGLGAPELTGRLIAANEQIKAATGVDLAASLRRPTP